MQARSSRLAFATLAAVLVLSPFALPGTAPTPALKADEPSFFLGALSLWHDRDLVCDEGDLRRLFEHFPGRADHLWLMSSDAWRTAHFGTPLPYPLLAAPVVGLLGARGLFALNAALLVAMIGMGAHYLRRFNPAGESLLLAATFFLLSATLSYVYWMQPEILGMASVTAAFYLVLGPTTEASRRRALAWGLSGAVLAVAIYLRPPVAVLAAPLLVLAWSRDRPRHLVIAWLLGMVLGLGSLAGLSWALVDEVWVHASKTRMNLSISSPVGFRERKLEPAAFPPDRPAEIETVWSAEGVTDLLRPVSPDPIAVADNLSAFFFGRHVGLAPYLPFALLAIALFLVERRRPAFGVLLIACALISGLAWVAYLPRSWGGGGGFVGNRYFLPAYPSLLFAVTRIRGAWTVPATSAVAALTLGAVLISPLGPVGGSPIFQHHTAGALLRLLPQELELSGIPGYDFVYHSGTAFHLRPDRTPPMGDEIWFPGGSREKLALLTDEPLEDAHFEVRSIASDNRVRLCLDGGCATVDFGSVPPQGETQPIDLPTARRRRLSHSRRSAYLHHLEVSATTGEQPRWRGSGPESYYLGAALTYLGSTREIARDVYRAAWVTVDAPSRMVAGREFEVPVAVRNESAGEWTPVGATRVLLAYHWEDDAGATVDWEGLRTPLPGTVRPGAEVTATLRVRAPRQSGPHVLVLDPVRERIAWFSSRRPAAAHRVAIEIVAP